MLKLGMEERCAEVLVAFPLSIVHRGHLVTWGVHRLGLMNPYVGAFKDRFGGGKDTENWQIRPVENGFTGSPISKRPKDHVSMVIAHSSIEQARARLAGDRLPNSPIRTFIPPPSCACGELESMLTAVEQLMRRDGLWVFYGQELQPGNLLKIGKIELKEFARELGRWRSRHQWAVREPSGTSKTLWAIRVGQGDRATAKLQAERLEACFKDGLAPCRYSFKAGVAYQQEWFHLAGDVLVMAERLKGKSTQDLLRVEPASRIGFYPSVP